MQTMAWKYLTLPEITDFFNSNSWGDFALLVGYDG